MKKFIILLPLILIASCGQDPLKANSSRLLSQSSSSPLQQNCRQNSGTVCGQPPMPVCPVGMACAQVMPSPQNYDNECVMIQAGARLLHDGACNNTTTP